ncbi:hypothetical protein V2J09_011310 [Rumex salicifolius]
MTGLINANPTVYEKKERRIRPAAPEVEDEYAADSIDELEHVRDIKDPEHPYSLEELKYGNCDWPLFEGETVTESAISLQVETGGHQGGPGDPCD